MDVQKSTNGAKPVNGGTPSNLATAGGVSHEDSLDTKSGPRLHSSLLKMRNATAERQDAFEGLREQERVLLSALEEELQAFADDVPKDDDWIVLKMSNGERPRYWVDPTSHVVIDRDLRTYRFLRDTRLGRIVVRESDSEEIIAHAIADYIAERMVERERAVDGEWLATVQANYDEDSRRRDVERQQQAIVPEKRKSNVGVYIAGLATGMIVIFGIWAYKDPSVVDPIKSLFETVMPEQTGSEPPES